jgi:hypothetical protein
MNGVVYWLVIAFLFFILLPTVAISLVTLIKFVLEKIRKRPTMGMAKFIITVVIGIVGLALIPPITYITSESAIMGTTITGNIATYTTNKNNSDIRYIELSGKKYQELETSISNIEYYGLSDDANLSYGKAIANVVWDDQPFMEAYIRTVFKYPINSQLIFPVKNRGMSDFISVEDTSLFCDVNSIDTWLAYYRNMDNYNYFVQDYNTDATFDIYVDDESLDEISKLNYLKDEYESNDTEKSLQEIIPQAVSVDVDSDYDLFTIMGESKNKIILHEVAEIYKDSHGKSYLFVEELWNDDGTVTLMLIPVPQQTNSKLAKIM